MKLSTSTNIVCDRPDGSVFPLEKTLELASQAGFKIFDMNFWDWALPHSPFLTDNWEKWIYDVANKASKLGVEFGQCHSYTFNFLDHKMSEDEYNYHQLLTKRSLECCSILGSKLCVTHPATDYQAVDLVNSSKSKNIKYFTELLEYSSKFNMELAIENMCDFSIAPKRKYCATPEELVDLIDEFNDSRLGICWDFEHADILNMLI